MHEVIASAFFDELFALEMEKYAFDLTPDRFDKITDALGKRWAAAGIDPQTTSNAMGALRNQLDQVAEAGGDVGSAAYRGAQERARDLAREYSKFAPGRKRVPFSRLDRLRGRTGLVRADADPYEARRGGADRPGAAATTQKGLLRSERTGEAIRTFKRTQQMKPTKGSDLGRAIRGKLGLSTDKYVGELAHQDRTANLANVDKKQLASRGQELIGRSARADVAKGTGKGMFEAAKKTLLPGLKALPTSWKIGGGAAGALLGRKMLFGDDDSTTIRVG